MPRTTPQPLWPCNKLCLDAGVPFDEEHMCSFCCENSWRGQTWWKALANQDGCHDRGKPATARVAASGKKSAPRDHVVQPQVKVATEDSFASPQEKYQGQKRPLSTPAEAAERAAHMTETAAILAALAGAGGMSVPRVVGEGKSVCKGKLADKGRRRQDDIGATMERLIMNLAATVAPDDPDGALHLGLQRLQGKFAEPARARVAKATRDLKLAKAAVSVLGGRGGDRRAAKSAAAAAAAAGTVLAEASKALAGLERTEDQAVAAESLLACIKGQTPEQRRPWMAALCQRSCQLDRQEISDMLGKEVTNNEYKLARQHARCPGVGQPVQKVQQQRMRVNSE